MSNYIIATEQEFLKYLVARYLGYTYIYESENSKIYQVIVVSIANPVIDMGENTNLVAHVLDEDHQFLSDIT
jgi:HD superfamily phosphohydrolase